MKKILIGSMATVAILIASVLALPAFINWNEYKEEITSYAQEVLGREIEIKGDIRIALLPSPVLRINDVHLANVEGGSNVDMVTLKSLEVNIALAPILGRNIQVTSVRLVEPVINLEVLESGTTNMTFRKTPTEKSIANNPPPKLSNNNQTQKNSLKTNGLGIPSFSNFAVQIDNFVIEKGQLTFRNTPKGRMERIQNLNGKFRLASLDGPMDMDGSAVVREIPLSFSASIGQIVQDRTLPFSLVGKIIPGNAEISYSGAISNLREQPVLKGKFSLKGANLSSFISGVANGYALPSALSRPFSARATITASQKLFAASDLTFTLDDTKGTGKITALLGSSADTTVVLAINKLDLDKLLSGPPQPKRVASIKPSDKGGNPSPLGIPPTKPKSVREPFSLNLIPENITAGLDLTIEAINFKGKAIRQAKLVAELANREVTLSQLSGLLPGNTDFAAFGFVSEKDNTPTFDGTVDIATNDLRGTLAWLGTETAGIANDRFRKFSFTSKMLARSKAISLSGMNMKIDSTSIKGSSAISLHDRVFIDTRLSVDRINLGAYLAAYSQISNPETRSTPRLRGNFTKEQQEKKPAANGSRSTKEYNINPLASLEMLNQFDMNTKAKFGSVTFKGLKISNVKIDSKLQNGTLKLKDLRASNLAGLEASMAGDLTGINSVGGVVDPYLRDFKIKIRGKSLKRFFKLMKIRSPIDPGKLGAVALMGTFNGKPQNLAVATQLYALQGSFAINGTAKPLDPIPTLAGQLFLSHPNLVSLINKLGLTYHPKDRKLGGLKLQSNIEAASTAIKLNDIKGLAAGVKLDGDMQIKLDRPKPYVTANLKTGTLNLNKYLSETRGASLIRALRPRRAFNIAPTNLKLDKVSWQPTNRNTFERGLLHNAAGNHWPRDPVNLAIPDTFDSDLILKAHRVHVGKITLDNISLSAALKNGVLNIDQASGNLFDGKVKLNGQTTTIGGDGQYKGSLTITGMNIPSALRAFENRTLKSGRMDMECKLKTSGRSIADLISRLNGTGSINLDRLDVSRGAGKGSAFSGVIDLLASIYQLAGSLGGQIGAREADLRSSFQINRGAVRYNDLAFNSSVATGSAKGVINLPNWQMKTAGALQLSQNLLLQVLADRKGLPPIPFEVSGLLNKPDVKIDTRKITGRNARIPGFVGKKLDKFMNKKGIGGLLKQIFPGTSSQQPAGQKKYNEAPLPRTQSQKKPQQPPLPKPEDFLKNILRGLGK